MKGIFLLPAGAKGRGGATDHYKLYGENIYYYDINSLYPYVMLKPVPVDYVGYHADLSAISLKTFFGYILA